MKTNEPVMWAQSLAGLLSAMILAGLVMADALGWVSLDINQMDAVGKFLAAAGAVFVFVAPQLVAAWWARSKVTPVAAPKMPDGEPAALVRMGDTMPDQRG